jgi:hypothetical protein
LRHDRYCTTGRRSIARPPRYEGDRRSPKEKAAP